MDERPNVLIFGGLDNLTPSLVQHLVPDASGQPLVGYLRIVDKFLVNPPTTYLSKEFLSRIKDRHDLVEYRQANLHIHDVVAHCFDDPAPNGRPFTHVFDLTGDMGFDRPAEVQISNTFTVSLQVGRAAAQRRVKAYVRMIGPFFSQADPKKKFKEEDERGWKPDGTRGVWWIETVRALGSIPDLPLVVLRIGIPYGPNMPALEVTTTVLMGLIYKKLNQDMKFLWSPKIRKNTCHIEDLCAVEWQAAEWIASIGRLKANELAGVALKPTGDKTVETVPDATHKSAGAVVVPVFNVVDDSDSTQESISRLVGNVFGIKTGSHGNIVSLIQGLRMRDVVEEVNELHMEQWSKIIQEASPPVPNTPLSPYIQLHILEEHGYAMDGEKLKRVLSFQHRHPQITEDGIRDLIKWFRKEGIWPESNLYVA